MSLSKTLNPQQLGGTQWPTGQAVAAMLCLIIIFSAVIIAENDSKSWLLWWWYIWAMTSWCRTTLLFTRAAWSSWACKSLITRETQGSQSVCKGWEKSDSSGGYRCHYQDLQSQFEMRGKYNYDVLVNEHSAQVSILTMLHLPEEPSFVSTAKLICLDVFWKS